LVRISDQAEEGAVMRPAKAISCILSPEGMDLVLYRESKDAPSQEVCWFVEVLHAFEESLHA
jgi:hypothetical protein